MLDFRAVSDDPSFEQRESLDLMLVANRVSAEMEARTRRLLELLPPEAHEELKTAIMRAHIGGWISALFVHNVRVGVTPSGGTFVWADWLERYRTLDIDSL